ncbi:MAG: hypothetical protein GDA48_16830 [Hormoscilla sp. GM102CHS1]|nr:hypothetical protein [Hormoscilla sp. GM102CHS1]
MKYASKKNEIVGQWIFQAGKIVPDASCKIIEHMISSNFVKVSDREDGWTTLYKEPVEQSYWELTYPDSELHGGGPPKLTKLSEEEVLEKYGECL